MGSKYDVKLIIEGDGLAFEKNIRVHLGRGWKIEGFVYDNDGDYQALMVKKNEVDNEVR